MVVSCTMDNPHGCTLNSVVSMYILTLEQLLLPVDDPKGMNNNNNRQFNCTSTCVHTKIYTYIHTYVHVHTCMYLLPVQPSKVTQTGNSSGMVYSARLAGADMYTLRQGFQWLLHWVPGLQCVSPVK